jgi:hypothetical protein
MVPNRLIQQRTKEIKALEYGQIQVVVDVLIINPFSGAVIGYTKYKKLRWTTNFAFSTLLTKIPSNSRVDLEQYKYCNLSQTIVKFSQVSFYLK